MDGTQSYKLPDGFRVEAAGQPLELLMGVCALTPEALAKVEALANCHLQRVHFTSGYEINSEPDEDDEDAESDGPDEGEDDAMLAAPEEPPLPPGEIPGQLAAYAAARNTARLDGQVMMRVNVAQNVINALSALRHTQLHVSHTDTDDWKPAGAGGELLPEEVRCYTSALVVLADFVENKSAS